MIGTNLGSDVQNRVDAYKENPAALQKRYMQSQELVDLLAMQKMKSEKAAYARDMQLKMESKPSTIAQQYEAELTGQTKNDMLKNVSGVLKNKQNQAQSNINEVAASGSGVAGQNASNMLKLAEGGIVGFETGGEVTNDLLRKINISRKDFDSLPKDTQNALIESIAAGTSAKDSELSRDLDAFLGPKERKKILKAAADQAVIDAPGQFSQIREYLFGDEDSYQDILDQREKAEKRKEYLENLANTDKPQFAPKTTGIDEKLIPDQTRMQQGQLSGIAGLDKKPVVPGVGVDDFAKDKSGGITDAAAAAPTFDASKFAADGAFNKEVKGGISDLLKSDPQKAVDFAARTPAEQAMIEKLLKERTDMRDNMMNPDKLSNDRLMQTLLGAKGATAGEAFRTSGLAGINAERNQENLRRSEFDAINKLFMDEANKSQSIKQKAFEGSQADKKQGVASGTSLTANEQTRALEADKLVATISNNAVQSSLKKDLNDIQKQRNNILQSGNVITGNTKMVQLYENAEATTIKTLTAAATKQKASNLGSDKVEKDKIIDAKLAADIKKLRETIQLKAAPFRDALKQATTNASAKTGGMTEVDKILGIK